MDAIYLSGNWTVLLEMLCCLVYIRRKKKRFSEKTSLLLIAVLTVVMFGLEHIYLTIDGIPDMAVMVINIILFKFTPMLAGTIFLTAGAIENALLIFAETFTTSELFAALISIGCRKIVLATEIREKWFQEMLIAAGCVLCFGALLVFLKKNGEVFAAETSRKTGILAATVSYISFAVGYVWGWMVREPEYFEINRYLSVSIYFCGTLILYMLQYMSSEAQLKGELQSIQNMLDIRYQQYKDYVETTSYLKRQLHDLKHQLAGMNISDENFLEYKQEMQKTIRKFETWNVSGNSVLDSLLTQKQQQCIEKEIQLVCNVDGKAIDFLAVRDICIIMGNLLDNAVEAAEKLEKPEDKIIQIEMKQKNQFLLIKVENRYQGQIVVKENSLPQTDKEDRENHGIGLKSVKITVEQYGGNLNIETEDGWFVVNVLIPVTKKEI